MADLKPGSSFNNRTTSGYPVSIGTSVCLEALFPKGMTRPSALETPPEAIDTRPYQSLYFNIDTLYRNLLASVNSQVVRSTEPIRVFDYLMEEMDVINSIFENEGANQIKLHYYLMEYTKLIDTSPNTLHFRAPNTEKQRIDEDRRLRVMEQLVQHTDELLHFDSTINFLSPEDRTLIITHQAYDLFSYKQVNQLHLLETHTAKLKKYEEWNTKYYRIPDTIMDRLPFNKRLFMILGDRNLIQPYPLKVRRQIMEIAHEKHWTPMTTDDKVRTNLLNLLEDPIAKNIIRLSSDGS